MKKKLSMILKVLFISLLLIFIICNYDTLKNLDIRTLVNSADSLLIASLIILMIYLIKGVTLVIPASLIYISVGMSIETKAALLINAIGIFLEISISYLLGLILGGDVVNKKLSSNKYGQKIIELQSKYKKSSTFVIRFLPVFPIDLCSLFWGSIRSNYPAYVLFSLLGIMPRVTLFTILGNGIYELIPMKYIVIAAVIIILIVGISVFIKSTIKKNSGENNV